MANNDNQLSIELKPEVASGTYSNLVLISHSQTEFIFDFSQVLPGLPKAQVAQRIIMAPEHAKRLLNAISDNIGKYESQFGEINIGQQPKGTINLTDIMGGGNGSKS